MTFLIRWGGRILAVITLAGLILVTGVSRGLLTPKQSQRVYPNELLYQVYPLASSNLGGAFRRFLDEVPQVTTLELDVPEVQANALVAGTLRNNGIPLSGSHMVFSQNRATLTLRVTLADLQALSSNERIKKLFLPWPLDAFRTRPLTMTLSSNISFDEKTHLLRLSGFNIALGQIDAGSAPALLWRSIYGRMFVHTAALALGMEDMAALKLSTTEPSMEFLASVTEEKLNSFLNELQKEKILEIREFALSEKRLRILIGVGQKITDELEYIDRVRQNPYYYGSAQQKLLGKALTPSECQAARSVVANYKQHPDKDYTTEEREAISLMEKALQDKDSICNNLSPGAASSQ